MTSVLDPTSERRIVERERLVRPASLDGLTVGLLDISKRRGDVFLTLNWPVLPCKRIV